MNQWLGFTSKFLEELMVREGRGDRERLKCCKCAKVEEDLYRCRSCSGGDLWCAVCIKDTHVRRPFDFIEVSNSDLSVY